MTAHMFKRPETHHEDENHHDAITALFDLQVEQHRHDENYHREIARLSIHQRLNHMTLHLAKYVGGIAEAQASKATEENVSRIIVDSLIIGISTANILNLKVSDLIVPSGTAYPSLTALGKFYLKAEGAHFDLLVQMAIAVGRMAKACESVDHLEALPYREVMTRNLTSILKLCLMALAARGLDPAREIHKRLDGVKARSIFHGHV